MRLGCLHIFRRHKVFCLALAFTMQVLLWLLQSDSRLLRAVDPQAYTIDSPFLTAIREPLSGVSLIPIILVNRPGTVLIFVLVLGGFCAFAFSGSRQAGRWWKSLILGMLHFAMQLGATIFIAATLDKGLEVWGDDVPSNGVSRDLLFAFLVIGAGAPINGFLFGLYLYLSNCAIGWHEQEIYSSQAIQNWKCFLRMEFRQDSLIIYPIGLRRVETTWKPALQQSVPFDGRLERMRKAVSALYAGDVFDVPKGTTHLYSPTTPLTPELIEAPIEIAKAESPQKVSMARPIDAPKSRQTRRTSTDQHVEPR